MTDQITREEAEKKVADFLEPLLLKAKVGDKQFGKWRLAFPKGFIPKQNESGEIIEIVGVTGEEDQEHVSSLLKGAQSGNSLAFDGLLAWAGWHLSKRREIPNEAVKSFLANYLCGFVEKPKPPRGRPKAETDHQLRQAVIGLAVWKVVEWGFCRTRNPDSKHTDSACDIVASAMARLNQTPCSYEHIQDIVAERTLNGIK